MGSQERGSFIRNVITGLNGEVGFVGRERSVRSGRDLNGCVAKCERRRVYACGDVSPDCPNPEVLTLLYDPLGVDSWRAGQGRDRLGVAITNDGCRCVSRGYEALVESCCDVVRVGRRCLLE